MAHSKFSSDSHQDHGSPTANLLHQNLDDVINSWDQAVQVFVLAAKSKTFTERVDSLEFFFHGLVEALSPGGEEIETGEAAHVFRRHGEQRASFEDYTLNQVIAEYSLLRTAIFEFFKSHTLSFKEQEIINRAIDFGIKESCSEFTNVRTAELRRVMLHAEAELQRERHLLNGFEDPFIAVNFDYRITFANNAALLLLREPLEELINKNLWDLIPSENSEEFQSCVAAAIEQSRTSVVELTTLNNELTYEARIYPCKDGASVLLLNSPAHHASNLLVTKDVAPRRLQT